MPVEIDPFFRHCGNGHSGWGCGALHCVLIPPLNPDPCLLNKIRVECKEGLHCGTRFGCLYALIFQETRFDCASTGSVAPLVLISSRHNPGVDETQVIWRNPCLTVAFPPRWPEKNVVYPVHGCRRPDGEACALPKVARVRSRRGSTEATHDQVMVRVVSCILDHQVM